MQNLNIDQIKCQQWHAVNAAQRICAVYTVLAFMDGYMIEYHSITGKVTSH
jgi:hypothetical protein